LVQDEKAQPDSSLGAPHYKARFCFLGKLKNFKCALWSEKYINLTIRRRTTTGQSVSQDLKDKIHNFIAFNKKQRYREFPSIIANMDETPIWTDPPLMHPHSPSVSQGIWL